MKVAEIRWLSEVKVWHAEPWQAHLQDVTNGTEDGKLLLINTMVAGAEPQSRRL